MKEDKFNIILSSAIEVLQSENYQKMKTASIAKGAGVAEGTIYRYFKNKKEIFKEAVKHALEKLEENSIKGLDKENSFEDNLEILKKNFLELKESGKRYYKIKYKAYSEVDDGEIREILLENTDREGSAIRTIFNWALEKNELDLSKEKIESMIYMIIAFSQYAIRLYTIGYSEVKIEYELKEVIEYIKKYIKNREKG